MAPVERLSGRGQEDAMGGRERLAGVSRQVRAGSQSGAGAGEFYSLVFENEQAEAAAVAARDAGADAKNQGAFVTDLHLDQIVEAITSDREERDLLEDLLYRPLGSTAAVGYRQEIFGDVEDGTLLVQLQRFSAEMRRVRSHLAQLEKMRSRYQKEGWFLDAAAVYCDAVGALVGALDRADLASRGLLAFRYFLSAYRASDRFESLAADTAARRSELEQVAYCVRIRGGRVDVSRYEGEPDYSAEVEATFERFQKGAVKDYRVAYRGWPAMNHVGAQILDLVARLFRPEFSALDDFCAIHAGFVDKTVRRFEVEMQFYLAYLDHIAPLRAAGLPFCYPRVSAASKEIFATETFDIALAARLVRARTAIVTNDLRLEGRERLFVVSGPNQGGKTTFARTFGQIHHLAAIGCPVPGRAARTFMFDQLLTHFGREEDLSNLSGRLEDNLVRAAALFSSATARSIVILNEIFASTTLSDARFLGRKVMDKLAELDVLGVYVTFVEELASIGGSVVSMVSTVAPDNPAERTYKVVRGPADGLAYALAIAERKGVTYERLRARFGAA
ncbi:MAG: MutS-related protein [Acidimicrobiales bacterium]